MHRILQSNAGNERLGPCEGRRAKALEFYREAQDKTKLDSNTGQIAGTLAASGDWLGVYELLAFAQAIEKPARRSDMMLRIAFALCQFAEMGALVSALLAGFPAELHDFDIARVAHCWTALGNSEQARRIMRSALVRVARQDEGDLLSFLVACEEEMYTLETAAYWRLPELLLQDNRWRRLALPGAPTGAGAAARLN